MKTQDGFISRKLNPSRFWHFSRDAARAAIFDYIEVFYNRQRLHQAIDYVSPVRYEEQRVVP